MYDMKSIQFLFLNKRYVESEFRKPKGLKLNNMDLKFKLLNIRFF